MFFIVIKVQLESFIYLDKSEIVGPEETVFLIVNIVYESFENSTNILVM